MGNALRVLGADYLTIECTTGLADGHIEVNEPSVILTVTAVDGHGDTKTAYASTSATVRCYSDEVATPETYVIGTVTLTNGVGTIDATSVVNAVTSAEEGNFIFTAELDETDTAATGDANREYQPRGITNISIYTVVTYLEFTTYPTSTERDANFTLEITATDQFGMPSTSTALNMTLSVSSTDGLDSLTDTTIASGEWVDGTWTGTNQITGGSGSDTFTITADDGAGITVTTSSISIDEITADFTAMQITFSGTIMHTSIDPDQDWTMGSQPIGYRTNVSEFQASSEYRSTVDITNIYMSVYYDEPADTWRLRYGKDGGWGFYSYVDASAVAGAGPNGVYTVSRVESSFTSTVTEFNVSGIVVG